MKQTTFKKEGYKKIICGNCGHCAKGEIHLNEKNSRVVKCPKCKTRLNYFPPRKSTNEKGEKIILWGPNEGMWTPDYTGEEIDPFDKQKPKVFVDDFTENEFKDIIKPEVKK